MPTFDQIESLNTQCYIHKKTGWEIEDFIYSQLDNEECIITICFSKKDENTIDKSLKTGLIMSNGNIIWG